MSTPRPIEFEDVRVGDEIRAERDEGVIRCIVGIITEVGNTRKYVQIAGDQIVGASWSLTLLSRPTEVRPVGSLWQDPESGTVWVRRDTPEIPYTCIQGGGLVGSVVAKSSPRIERLVPWSPAGTT